MTEALGSAEPSAGDKCPNCGGVIVFDAHAGEVVCDGGCGTVYSEGVLDQASVFSRAGKEAGHGSGMSRVATHEKWSPLLPGSDVSGGALGRTHRKVHAAHDTALLRGAALMKRVCHALKLGEAQTESMVNAFVFNLEGLRKAGKPASTAALVAATLRWEARANRIPLLIEEIKRALEEAKARVKSSVVNAVYADVCGLRGERPPFLEPHAFAGRVVNAALYDYSEEVRALAEEELKKALSDFNGKARGQDRVLPEPGPNRAGPQGEVPYIFAAGMLYRMLYDNAEADRGALSIPLPAEQFGRRVRVSETTLKAKLAKIRTSLANSALASAVGSAARKIPADNRGHPASAQGSTAGEVTATRKAEQEFGSGRSDAPKSEAEEDAHAHGLRLGLVRLPRSEKARRLLLVMGGREGPVTTAYLRRECDSGRLTTDYLRYYSKKGLVRRNGIFWELTLLGREYCDGLRSETS